MFTSDVSRLYSLKVMTSSLFIDLSDYFKFCQVSLTVIQSRLQNVLSFDVPITIPTFVFKIKIASIGKLLQIFVTAPYYLWVITINVFQLSGCYLHTTKDTVLHVKKHIPIFCLTNFPILPTFICYPNPHTLLNSVSKLTSLHITTHGSHILSFVHTSTITMRAHYAWANSPGSYHI